VLYFCNQLCHARFEPFPFFIPLAISNSNSKSHFFSVIIPCLFSLSCPLSVCLLKRPECVSRDILLEYGLLFTTYHLSCRVIYTILFYPITSMSPSLISPLLISYLSPLLISYLSPLSSLLFSLISLLFSLISLISLLSSSLSSLFSPILSHLSPLLSSSLLLTGAIVVARMEVLKIEERRLGLLLTCATQVRLGDREGQLAVDGEAKVLLPHRKG
jgi:hypothetical protein